MHIFKNHQSFVMRNKYLLPALMTLILLSCKKDTKEIAEIQPSVATDDYTLCYGTNTWENSVSYVGDFPQFHVTYNGKIYYFHNDIYNPNDPFHDKITIFDGTSWQVLTSAIPFEPLSIGFAFVIGDYGYFGYTQFIGYHSSHGTSWRYDFTNNTWTSIEDFPGYYTMDPAFFQIGNKGYVVGGYKDQSYTRETWEFDPAASPKWRKRADHPGTGRENAKGFSIGKKGYIVNGQTITTNPLQRTYYKTLLEFDPLTNTWTTKASFPGTAREFTKSFVIAGKAYVGGGRDHDNYFSDFYKYDPADNDWVRVADFATTGELWDAFTLDSKGYAVWRPASPQPMRLKKYDPVICTTISTGGVVIP